MKKWSKRTSVDYMSHIISKDVTYEEYLEHAKKKGVWATLTKEGFEKLRDNGFRSTMTTFYINNDKGSGKC